MKEISNDRRRKVAESLRKAKLKPFSLVDGIARAVFDKENITTVDLVRLDDELADLIDRPTCTMEYDMARLSYVCTSCGQLQCPEACGGYGPRAPFRYCPYCGAEVIHGEAASVPQEQ